MIDNELVKKAYLFDVSRIYGEHILIDLDYLQSIEEELITGKCVCCGKKAKHHVIWGIQY